MATPLDQAIDMAVRGEYPPESSSLDGHDFYIRALGNRNMLREDETSYFRHEHVGKDDRVFSSVALGSTRGEYQIQLTRIQFRGPWVKNGFRDIDDRGIDVTDAVDLILAAQGLPTSIESWKKLASIIEDLDLQGFLDGNWIPAATKVIDKIGQRMAQDLPISIRDVSQLGIITNTDVAVSKRTFRESE